jgi:hypothetical protein
MTARSSISRVRPILVEFVGASGVGKSYLLARVGEALRQRGAQVHDLDAIRTREFHPASVLLVLKAGYLVKLTRQKSRHHYPAMVKRLAQDMIRRRAVTTGADGIYLCSEGPFQRARALYRGSADLDMAGIADLLFRHIVPPDVVIAVEAHAPTIYSRRVARGKRVDSFSLESVAADVALLEESIRTIEHVQRHVAPQMHLLRVDLDNPDATPAVASRLASALEGIASRRAEPLRRASEAGTRSKSVR